jgi:hypothetical protein
MYLMNATTAFETLIFLGQLLVLIGNIHSGKDLCGLQTMPTFGITSCTGILTLVYSTNAAFIVLYMYFCCVAYEHYWMGLKNPKFIVQEAKRLN